MSQSPIFRMLMEDNGEGVGAHTEREVNILPEVQIDELRRLYQAYLEGAINFKPGDLVTPRLGMSFRGTGLPHIVLEVRYDAKADFTVVEHVPPCSPEYGGRRSVRVACYMTNDTMACYWMEPHTLEPYRGK